MTRLVLYVMTSAHRYLTDNLDGPKYNCTRLFTVPIGETRLPFRLYYGKVRHSAEVLVYLRVKSERPNLILRECSSFRGKVCIYSNSSTRFL